MKYYAVIDTNVIVSAFLKKDSIPDAILNLSLNGYIIPLINDEIISEYYDVLSRDKFRFDQKIVNDFIDEIKERSLFIYPDHYENNIIDLKDVIFYEVVMEKRKSSDAYLITGNTKHFPVEPFILTPKEMLELILDNI